MSTRKIKENERVFFSCLMWSRTNKNSIVRCLINWKSMIMIYVSMNTHSLDKSISYHHIDEFWYYIRYKNMYSISLSIGLNATKHIKP